MSFVNQASLLVVTRDHGQFIATCLESVVENISAELQVFLVDVGSLDDTVVLAENYLRGHFGDFQIIQIDRESNPLDAYEAVRKLIVTPFLIAISGDDSFGAGFAKAVEKYTAAPENPWVINFELNLIDEEGIFLECRNPRWVGDRKRDRQQLLMGNPGTAPGTIYPWYLVRELDFWRDYPNLLIEDYFIWWQLIDKVTFVNSDESSVNYLRHSLAMTTTKVTPKFAEALGFTSGYSYLRATSLFDYVRSTFFLVKNIRRIRPKMFKNFAQGVKRGCNS